MVVSLFVGERGKYEKFPHLAGRDPPRESSAREKGKTRTIRARQKTVRFSFGPARQLGRRMPDAATSRNARHSNPPRPSSFRHAFSASICFPGAAWRDTSATSRETGSNAASRYWNYNFLVSGELVASRKSRRSVRTVHGRDPGERFFKRTVLFVRSSPEQSEMLRAVDGG